MSILDMPSFNIDHNICVERVYNIMLSMMTFIIFLLNLYNTLPYFNMFLVFINFDIVHFLSAHGLDDDLGFYWLLCLINSSA